MSNLAAKGTSNVFFPGTMNNSSVNNSFLSKFGSNLITGIDTTKQKISGIDFDNTFYQNVFQKREENAVEPEIINHLKFTESTRTNETRLFKSLSCISINLSETTFMFSMLRNFYPFLTNIFVILPMDINSPSSFLISTPTTCVVFPL